MSAMVDFLLDGVCRMRAEAENYRAYRERLAQAALPDKAPPTAALFRLREEEKAMEYASAEYERQARRLLCVK